MLMLLTIIIIPLAITSILGVCSIYLTSAESQGSSVAAPFECGFEAFTSARVPFSLKFFMVALIFLIFDVEIAFVIVLPLTSCISWFGAWATVSFWVYTLLGAGLVVEWKAGSLSWVH